MKRQIQLIKELNKRSIVLCYNRLTITGCTFDKPVTDNLIWASNNWNSIKEINRLIWYTWRAKIHSKR